MFFNFFKMMTQLMMMIQLMTFARWLRLWLITRSQLVSLRALLLTSAPLAGICSGSSLLMAHLAVRWSRHALLHCSFDAVRLARLAWPSASSNPLRGFFALPSDIPLFCPAKKKHKIVWCDEKQKKLITIFKFGKSQNEGWSFECKDVF